MGTISANTLFHFTNSKENLISILTSHFHLRYCLEKFYLAGDVKCAIPMVCFCDIPLSKIKKHAEKYGNYALGLNKNWANKKGLNPILYMQSSSALENSLSNLFSDILSLDDEKKLFEKILHLSYYMKPYSDPDDSNRVGKFYDEKEWRYTLPEKLISNKNGNIELFLEETKYNHSDVLKKANDSIISYGLKFTPRDINYIIVNNEREIPELIDVIKTNNFASISKEEIDILTTRIISMQRVKNDF